VVIDSGFASLRNVLSASLGEQIGIEIGRAERQHLGAPAGSSRGSLVGEGGVERTFGRIPAEGQRLSDFVDRLLSTVFR